MLHILRCIVTVFLCGQVVTGQDPEICFDDDISSSNICFQGSTKLTHIGKSYQSFQGIPYAAPPVGELRFMAPKAFEFQPDQVIDVSGSSETACAQLDMITTIPEGEEDCLLLNVYVPEDIDEMMPVMIWIHGGSLTQGSNSFESYGPMHFIDRGIVVVVINYRLGPFGFLSLGNELVPGNTGFHDQIMAFQWVQNHIHSFKGNSDKVTVFGESAGSTSIAYHLLSPKSKGLFQRGILQSGSAVGISWSHIPVDKAVEYSNLFASNLGCAHGDMTCLQSKSMEDILAQTFMLDVPGDDLTNSGTAWQAVIDTGFTSDPFLPGDPQELLNSNEVNSEVEVMLGTNRDEGILFMIGEMYLPSQYETMASKWDVYGPMRVLGISNPEDITPQDVEKAQKVLKFYTGGDGNFDQEHFMDLVTMFTDSAFLYGVHKTIKAFVSNKMKVFQYVLTYEGAYSQTEVFFLPPAGVCHGDDLIYLWDPVFGLDPETHPLLGDDVAVRNFMVTAWANFASFGDPTPPIGTQSSTWLPVGPDNNQYMNISGPNPHMDEDQDITERMEFWNTLGY